MATIHIKSDSQEWFLQSEEINKIRVFHDLIDSCDDTDVYELNICDEHNVFDIVVKLLRMPIEDVGLYIRGLPYEKQIKLYTLCDYLNIHVLQIRIAKVIANKLNALNMTQLKNAISILA